VSVSVSNVYDPRIGRQDEPYCRHVSGDAAGFEKQATDAS
jgi:hypothetical protein